MQASSISPVLTAIPAKASIVLYKQAERLLPLIVSE